MQTNYNLVVVLVAYLGSCKREAKGAPEGGVQRRRPKGVKLSHPLFYHVTM